MKRKVRGQERGGPSQRQLRAAELVRHALVDIVAREDFVDGRGDYAEASIFCDYATDLGGRVKIARPLKVVIDTGNGTAGAFAPRIFKDAGLHVIEHQGGSGI